MCNSGGKVNFFFSAGINFSNSLQMCVSEGDGSDWVSEWVRGELQLQLLFSPQSCEWGVSVGSDTDGATRGLPVRSGRRMWVAKTPQFDRMFWRNFILASNSLPPAFFFSFAKWVGAQKAQPHVNTSLSGVKLRRKNKKTIRFCTDSLHPVYNIPRSKVFWQKL